VPPAGSLGWLADASFLACPSCGARLVAKTSDRPPRLTCVSCGRLQPQTTQQPLLGLLDRHGIGLLALLLLISMPLVLTSLSPWLEQSQYRGRDHVRRTKRQGSLEPSRWDFRTGIVRRGQR